MKQLFSVAGAAMLLAFAQPAQAQRRQTLEGNGNIVTKTISVDPFTALDASGVFELTLVQGNTESITIETDENLQALFTVRNSGNKLVIEMKDREYTNRTSANRMRVQVQFKNLSAITLKMVGHVRGSNLKFGELRINNQSVGNVELELDATTLKLDNAGVGNVILSGEANHAVIKSNSVGALRAGNLKVQTVDIDNNGVGSAEVYAEQALNVTDSFLGKVKNRGGARMRKMNKVVI